MEGLEASHAGGFGRGFRLGRYIACFLSVFIVPGFAVDWRWLVGGVLRRTIEDVKVRAAIGARAGVERATLRATRRTNMV